MNPDWDGVMKARAHELKPGGTFRVVAQLPRADLDVLVALLREGCELSLSNQRAASQRRALFDWGERVNAALAEIVR